MTKTMKNVNRLDCFAIRSQRLAPQPPSGPSPHKEKEANSNVKNLLAKNMRNLSPLAPCGRGCRRWVRGLKKAAFTLAEVLITLGIIGVVAALTIPTLVNNYQEKASVTKLKKLYSIVSQAVKLAEVDNGPIEDWGFTSPYGPEDAEILSKNLSPYFKV